MEYLSEHLVGFIIIGLSIVLTGGGLLFARLSWAKKNKVDEWYRGVGIIYREGAVRPWPGIRTAIDSILDQQAEEEEPFKSLKGWKDFWVEVIAYENLIITKEHTTGYVWASGPRVNFPCPPPQNEAEADMRAIVNGTRRTTKWIFFAKKAYHVCVVRQIKSNRDKIDARLRREEGAVRDAGKTALHHEHAEHHVSVLKYGDANVYHKREDLKALKIRMRQRYNDLWQRKTNT